jgi:tripartite-type tricarboxylate transporter receptor subunit TctC
MIFGRYVLGRPILSPPGVPAERAAILRAAFTATMKDPEFLADAKKLKLEISPSSGEEVARMVTRFFSYPPAVVAKAISAME